MVSPTCVGSPTTVFVDKNVSIPFIRDVITFPKLFSFIAFPPFYFIKNPLLLLFSSNISNPDQKVLLIQSKQM